MNFIKICHLKILLLETRKCSKNIIFLQFKNSTHSIFIIFFFLPYVTAKVITATKVGGIIQIQIDCFYIGTVAPLKCVQDL